MPKYRIRSKQRSRTVNTDGKPKYKEIILWEVERKERWQECWRGVADFELGIDAEAHIKKCKVFEKQEN